MFSQSGMGPSSVPGLTNRLTGNLSEFRLIIPYSCPQAKFRQNMRPFQANFTRQIRSSGPLLRLPNPLGFRSPNAFLRLPGPNYSSSNPAFRKIAPAFFLPPTWPSLSETRCSQRPFRTPKQASLRDSLQQAFERDNGRLGASLGETRLHGGSKRDDELLRQPGGALRRPSPIPLLSEADGSRNPMPLFPDKGHAPLPRIR